MKHCLGCLIHLLKRNKNQELSPPQRLPTGNLLTILGLGGHGERWEEGKGISRALPFFPSPQAYGSTKEASVEERELRSKPRGKIVKIHTN